MFVIVGCVWLFVVCLLTLCVCYVFDIVVCSGSCFCVVGRF